MKLYFYVLLFILVFKWITSQNVTLFDIKPYSLMCSEGVNLYLPQIDETIPCVKCTGDGDLNTDGFHLYCENQKSEKICLDQPTYFAMMFGDFVLCVRRAWWYDDFLFYNNANIVYSSYRDYKNNQ